MEEDPFALVESMTIAGFATGCEKGFLYVRGEYPLAYSRGIAPRSRRRAPPACWATNILGRGVRFDIEIRRGAGAYICGEETALFNSIEGLRGEPRNKPPFPVQAGLFGKPTVVNNVETLVNVPHILLMGGAAFAKIGTEQSTGTRLFCVSGNVEKPGLYEAPFGITARQLLDMAGGVTRGKTLQTVLLGGAAGVFIRPDELDMPLTFEGTRAAKATLGSGVFLVFDDTVDLDDDAAAHRRVLPRRVVRAVRAVPRRHRAPGRSAPPHRRAQDARRHRRRDRAAGRSRHGDEGRVHLRTGPDGVQRHRERDPPAWAIYR